MIRPITKYFVKVSSSSFLFVLLLQFLFSSNHIHSQTISSIEISSNKTFSKNDYLSWSKISSGQKLFNGIADSLNKRISYSLRLEGYYSSKLDIQVISIDSNSSKIIIDVDEDEPTFIGKIKFSNTSADSSEYLNFIEGVEGKIFSQRNIENFTSEILDHFENNGFPFASVTIEAIFFRKDSSEDISTADLIFNFDQGEQSKIDRIEIAGNSKTKDYVIIRELGITQGEVYRQELIDKIPERLNKLRFFDPVERPDYYFNSKNEGILKIKIKEKVTNNFDGIFGYVPSLNDKDKDYFTGFVNVTLRNLLGTGRSAAFKWQQENRNSQELELKYLEPWIFDYPFSITASLYQRKQDSTYVQRSFEGALEFAATKDISASLLLNSQSTIPTERQNKIFTVFNSSSLTTGINIKIDTRDDYYAPTKGIVLVNSYKYITKKIDGPKEYITPTTKTSNNFQRLELDFSYFLGIFSNQVAALGIHGRELRGSDVELSDLYLLGGMSTLRGYREKQFQGNRIFWSNLEYRFLLASRSFAFLFLDTGYFLRAGDQEKNIPEISDYKIGYGFGLNIETGIGVLGVSFALGKGDSFRDGKIHFGIINEF